MNIIEEIYLLYNLISVYTGLQGNSIDRGLQEGTRECVSRGGTLRLQMNKRFIKYTGYGQARKSVRVGMENTNNVPLNIIFIFFPF